MQPLSWDRIEGWWADLFGFVKALLWQGLSVRPHARLGDHEDILLALRDAGCHVSLPVWADNQVRESLSQQGISRLGDPEYWRENASTSRLRVLGPSVHRYTDQDPWRQEPDEGGPPVEEDGELHLTRLAEAVGEADWDESGFSSEVLKNFVVRDVSGAIAAAANLTEYSDSPQMSVSWSVRKSSASSPTATSWRSDVRGWPASTPAGTPHRPRCGPRSPE